MKSIELTNKEFELLGSIIARITSGYDDHIPKWLERQDKQKIFENINNKFYFIKNKRKRKSNKIKWNSPDCY